jgi:hypothetical protein
MRISTITNINDVHNNIRRLITGKCFFIIHFHVITIRKTLNWAYTCPSCTPLVTNQLHGVESFLRSDSRISSLNFQNRNFVHHLILSCDNSEFTVNSISTQFKISGNKSWCVSRSQKFRFMHIIRNILKFTRANDYVTEIIKLQLPLKKTSILLMGPFSSACAYAAADTGAALDTTSTAFSFSVPHSCF